MSERQEQLAAVKAAALEYLEAGLSLLPVGGDKRPYASPGGQRDKWKAWQETRPTADQVEGWYQRAEREGQAAGVAILGGQVSGNLLILDFDYDAETIYPQWRALLSSDYPELAAALEEAPVAKTGKGYHVYLRLEQARPNETLAAERIEDRLEKYIETRGEGGYVVAPPSPHPSGHFYQWERPLSGPPPCLDEKQEETLLKACSHFDKREAQPVQPRRQTTLPDLRYEDKPSLEELGEALSYIPKHQDYDDWLDCLMAVHSVYPGPEGVALIESWSPGYQGEVASKFRSFSPDGKIGVGTLFYLAKQHGWKPKMSERPIQRVEQPAKKDMREAAEQFAAQLEEARGAERLILIEDAQEREWIIEMGWPIQEWPIVAIGERPLSKKQAEQLQATGAQRLILALSVDKEGQAATKQAIKALLEEMSIERLLVATWPYEEGYGDNRLWFIIADEGPRVEDGIAAVNQAVRVGSWLGMQLTQSLFFVNPQPLEEEALLEQGVEQYLWLARQDKLQARDFVRALAEGLNWDEQLIWPRLAKAEERLKEKESREALEAQLTAAGAALSKGDRGALLEALETAARAARGGGLAALPEPYPLEQLLADIEQELPALSTGWPSLDDTIAGFPRAALSVIAGPTGQGKTTLMLNLLARWSTRYPEERFYFYSYEEPASHIALKLIMIKAGVVLSKTDNLGAYRNYLRFHRGEQEKLDQAIQWYQERAESGRLILDYSMPSVEELAGTLALLGKRGGVGAVLLDYIQRIPVSRTSQSRQLELAYATQLLREAAVGERLAIVTGSQVNDDGQLREARDIHHEASLALILKSKADEDNGEEPDMSIQVLKNRNGPAGGKVFLSYQREALALTEKQPAARHVQGGGKFH